MPSVLVSRLRGHLWMVLVGASLAVVLLVTAALGGAGGAGAAGAGNGPAGFHARHGHQVVLPGVVPPAVASAKRGARQSAADQLQLSIGLQPANRAGLLQLLKDQQDPKSPRYHHYLAPGAYAAAYGPPPAEVAAVRTFLRQVGLRVTGVSKGNALIDVTGSAAQVEQAFGIHLYHYTLGKRAFTAPDHDPLIPDTLATSILNIGGLDTLFHMSPRISVQAQSPSRVGAGAAPKVPAVCQGDSFGFDPGNLQGAYDVGPLISDMEGITTNVDQVAVFELAPYLAGDVTSYRDCYFLPNPAINDHPVDGALVTGDAPGTLEADLDVEVVSAITSDLAFGHIMANQDVYTGPNTTAGINDTYQAIAGGTDQVVTTSWGLCEPFSGQAELSQLDTIFAQMRSQGKTIFAASGDSGSDDCRSGGDFGFNVPPAVDSPADDPNVVGVGGTSLTLGAGNTYDSETVWNNGFGGGGGGLSSYFSRPSWQAANGVLNDYNPGGSLREVPDVAADADLTTGYATYCTSVNDCTGNVGGWIEVGGTSAAAPLWAGIYALIDGDSNWHNAHIGWANQLLYDAFANTQFHAPFHDVASGNNDVDYTSPPFQGDYPAASCYDMANGMGSPDAWNIEQDFNVGISTVSGGPCAAPATPTYSELLGDNGFEQAGAGNPSPWQGYSSGGFDPFVGFNAHGGIYAAFLCGYPSCDDRVWQTITVPTPVHSATLSFWADGVTPLVFISSPPLCWDHFTVTLAKPDGTVVDTVQATCQEDAQSFDGYVLVNIPLTSALQTQEGQTLLLTFRATSTNVTTLFSGLYNQWFLDDVSLQVS